MLREIDIYSFEQCDVYTIRVGHVRGFAKIGPNHAQFAPTAQCDAESESLSRSDEKRVSQNLVHRWRVLFVLHPFEKEVQGGVVCLQVKFRRRRKLRS